MSFQITKSLSLLAQPSFLLFLCLLLGTLLVWRRWRRSGLTLLGLASGFQLLLILLPIDSWLLAPLENRFPQPNPPPAHVDGIIVLGGAVRSEMTEVHGTPSLNGAAERMTAFVGLARRYPGARLAFTGGSGRLVAGHVTESEVARRLFEELGLTQPVIYDEESRTTYENAVFLRQKVRPAPGETWLLVTSAWHMPRSVGAFRRAGWEVLPWPVDYRSGASYGETLENSLPDKLGNLDGAVHEWLGLLGYRLMGRSATLFPGPGE